MTITLTGKESFKECEAFRGQEVILPTMDINEADRLISALTYWGVESIGLIGSVQRVVPGGPKTYLLPNFGWVVYAALRENKVAPEFCSCPSGTTGPFGPWIDWTTKQIIHNGSCGSSFRVYSAKMADIIVGEVA
jgi:hypothetical protein